MGAGLERHNADKDHKDEEVRHCWEVLAVRLEEVTHYYYC
eukprot:COSAG05_NODE_29_length_29038_cov_1237.466985_26_plen_40_part_00